MRKIVALIGLCMVFLPLTVGADIQYKVNITGWSTDVVTGEQWYASVSVDNQNLPDPNRPRVHVWVWKQGERPGCSHFEPRVVGLVQADKESGALGFGVGGLWKERPYQAGMPVLGSLSITPTAARVYLPRYRGRLPLILDFGANAICTVVKWDN